jgi:transketolase
MGNMLHRAIEAWEKLAEKNYQVQILNLSCLSEIDTKAIKEGAETGIIITYEDHSIKTGMGSIVANVIAENSLRVRFVKMGITAYGASGKPEELFKAQGLDVNTLIGVVVKEIEKIS